MKLVRLVLFLGAVIVGFAAPYGVDAADGGTHSERTEMACPGSPDGHVAAAHEALPFDMSGHCVGLWLRREEWPLDARLQMAGIFVLLSDAASPRARLGTETPPPRRG